ncbi:MAG: efflux RND transporter periplasmic adaptor subunit [Candidatus Brocadiae bacterium]|nr:efflux RND transporter periplasmic adaptor subunit [Candidatus Brocadiia bacterium]
MKKTILPILNFIVFFGLLSLGYYSFQKVQAMNKTQEEKARSAIRVKVVKVSLGDIQEKILLTGTVYPYSKVQIYSKLAGRLEKLFVDKGSFVEKGHVLGIVDHDVLKAQENQAKANLNVTKAQVLSAEKNIERSEAELTLAKTQLHTVEVNLANLDKDRQRYRILSREGSISKQMLDTIETQYKAMEMDQLGLKAQVLQAQASLSYAQAQKKVCDAQLEASQATLEMATSTLNESTIKATISGVVSEKYSDQGDTIGNTKAMSDPILDLMSIDKVKILVHVPEVYLNRLHKDKVIVFSVDAYPDEIFSAKITRIGPTLKVATRTMETEIVYENTDYRLRPGMFARIPFIVKESKEAILVPADALIRQEGLYFAFIAVGNKAKKIAITPGIWAGNTVEVKPGSDLKQGDMLIVRGQANLIEESKIEIIGEKHE